MNLETIKNNHLNKLTDNGFEAYIVGGAVRDILSNITPSDFDIATNASPDDITIIFRDSNIDFVGKSFGVSIVDGLEIATYRKDKYNGFDSNDIEITRVKTIEEDLARRDFTINAMAMDNNGNVIDPFNGQQDLKNKIIRFVGDPIDRIIEDPNRIIRACRFLAKVNGTFDERSLTEMKNYINEYGISHIAPERIRIEILKAMEIKKASRFFEALYESKILALIFPELYKCCDHEHGNHHEEDIFNHMMLTGDSITTKNPLLKLAGYLHDIGKPQSFDHIKKTFYSHHRFGEEIVIGNLIDLKFSNNEIEYIATIIRTHMMQTPKNHKHIRRTIKRFVDRKVDYRDWLRIKIADRNGRISNKSSYAISELKSILRNFINFKDNIYEVIKLPVNGNDVMNILHLEQSKEVGNVLKNLLDYVIEHGDIVNNRDHLLEKITKEGSKLVSYTKPTDLPRE
ncbi:CCA tRNA nucleotidyltransferase [Candidatus Pacearchaeota archaeon]|nr:CCA tRNA nucleotidyltransferase [Candidatus Pacearchaeota archaeon]